MVGGKIHTGLIAHEFAEVSPTSVTGVKDGEDEIGMATKEGNPDFVDIREDETPEGYTWTATGMRPVYQSMQASTSEVIGNIVAELQALRRRVTELDAV